MRFLMKTFFCLLALGGSVFFPLPQALGQVITRVAGNATPGYSGDGGPATQGSLSGPDDLAVDSLGNLFIADAGAAAVRKVDRITGVISTVAGGTTTGGFSGDGGPATLGVFFYPSGIALDSGDNLYISDYYNNEIRKVDASSGILNRVAGSATPGYSGDGGPATLARINSPVGLVVDPQGNFYFSDSSNHVVRRVSAGTGTITTVAGNGTPGFSGDGGPATQASLKNPQGLRFDSNGNLYVTDMDSFVVRKVASGTGTITTVAGNATPGYSGDGGPATQASFSSEVDNLVVDCAGNLFITDDLNHRIRMVSAADGKVYTVAGTGTPVSSGDGGPPSAAGLAHPEALAFDAGGNLYLAEYDSNLVRKIAPFTVLCTPTPTFSPTLTPTGTPTPGPTATPTAVGCGAPIESYCYPNPATGNTTTILCNLCEPGLVDIRVYNTATEQVEAYSFQGTMGVNRFSADIGGLSHGIYYYVVKAGGSAGTHQSKTCKFAVVR